jgi:hypothetical protein
MTFTGEVTLMNQSLAADSTGGDWGISIRRSDGKADRQFTEYDQKPVTPTVIAKFIPNWRALKWKEVNGIAPLPRESFAADEKYNINIVVRDGAALSHEERQSRFIAFMESETA